MIHAPPTHFLPGVEVHACQLAEVGLGNVDVEGLALVNIGPSVSCHVNESTLGELPHSLVQSLQLLRNAINFLHGISVAIAR